MLNILPNTDLWSIRVPKAHSVPGLFFRTVPVFHESVDGLAVSNREVHNLRFLSLVCESVFKQWLRRLAFRVIPFEQNLFVFKCFLNFWVHSQSSSWVEVTTQFECLYHTLALRHVCKDSQLKLTIICNDQRLALFGDERRSYFVLIFVQRGLVLEIWSLARDPPSFCVQIHWTMDPSMLVDLTLKRFDVSWQKLFDMLEF